MNDDVVKRVRGEFREMPGLRLTTPQACRLWQLDRESCEAVLATLIAERFLFKTADGAYMALPTPRRQAPATVPSQARKLIA